jgi:hypothetical protein
MGHVMCDRRAQVARRAPFHVPGHKSQITFYKTAILTANYAKETTTESGWKGD